MPKIEKEITVRNAQGLHARPAAIFVQIAVRYEANISVTKEGETVNGKSIMGILMLGAEQGGVVKIIADGADANKLVNELEAFLTQNG